MDSIRIDKRAEVEEEKEWAGRWAEHGRGDDAVDVSAFSLKRSDRNA